MSIPARPQSSSPGPTHSPRWERAIAAGGWKLFGWLWASVIVGGFLVNVIISLITTGNTGLTDWHTWFLLHLILAHPLRTVLLLATALTLSFYLAYRSQQRLQRALSEHSSSSQTIVQDKALPPSPMPPIQHTASSPIWTVPFRRNPFFTGREELLKNLHDQLTDTKKAALTQALAIHGLGGVGKTQIAVEYAYRYQHEYQAVLWVRAATRDTLISDYVTIASLLHLSGQDEQNQLRMVEAVKQRLNSQPGWLLMLDNADDLTVIPDFLPSSGKGHLLLTTRDPAVEGMAQSIEVAQMDGQEGMRLLLQRAHVLTTDAPLTQASEEDRTIARSLVEKLGGLPLAIDQAGAYIEQTRCSLSRYLELYQQHRADLFKWQQRVPSAYARTVASTWELAFVQVEQRNPAAANLLRYCAFLDPDSIAEDLFIEGASKLSPELQPVVENAFKFNEALDLLRSFSLIRRLTDTQSIAIHRLVQLVLKDRMDNATQQKWAKRTVRLVNAAFPTVEFKNWNRCKRYLPQVLACAELIDQYSIQTKEAGELLDRGGWYLNDHARNSEAEPLYQQALRIKEQVMGAEHPDTSATLNNLATLYRDQERYAEAEPLFLRSLRIYEQTRGPEHPNTAATLDNLAQLYRGQGRYAEAELLYQRALHIREQVLGPEHPDTATTLHNLAQLYRAQGRYAEAEPLYLRALRISEQVLGPEHPDMATTLHDLALLYQNQGRYAEAEPLYQRALHIYEQRLPANHPWIATAIRNYASLLRQMKRSQEASKLEARIQTKQPEQNK